MIFKTHPLCFSIISQIVITHSKREKTKLFADVFPGLSNGGLVCHKHYIVQPFVHNDFFYYNPLYNSKDCI